jgi:hypothetical protein
MVKKHSNNNSEGLQHFLFLFTFIIIIVGLIILSDYTNITDTEKCAEYWEKHPTLDSKKHFPSIIVEYNVCYKEYNGRIFYSLEEVNMTDVNQWYNIVHGEI